MQSFACALEGSQCTVSTCDNERQLYCAYRRACVLYMLNATEHEMVSEVGFEPIPPFRDQKKELAVTWACEKFRTYISGLHVVVQTDHRPLVSLLNTKNLDQLSPRIQRFRMRLTWFGYEVVYVPRSNLATADALSRASILWTDSVRLESFVESFVHQVISSRPATSHRLNEIRQAIEHDEVSQAIIKFCQNGWPRKVSDHLKAYFSVCDEITFAEGLLLRGYRLIIPVTLQNDVITRIHSGHQGIVKCRRRAYASVWWPRINDDIETFVSRCHVLSEGNEVSSWATFIVSSTRAFVAESHQRPVLLARTNFSPCCWLLF